MVDIIISFFTKLFDEATSWKTKTATIVIIIASIFCTDYIFKFSYNYHLNTKIEQLKDVNNLKPFYQSDTSRQNKLLVIEKAIFSKTHYSESLFGFSLDVPKVSFTPSKTEQNNIANKTPNTNTNNPMVSLFWMTISSSSFFIIAIPFLLLLPLFYKEERSAVLIGALATLVVSCLFAYLSVWAAYQIPIILDNPIFNYILNFIIHSIIIYITYRIVNKYEEE